MPFAEVAVNAPGAGRRTFSYSIPDHLRLQPGHAVWVPFGRLVRQGIVMALAERPAVEETRPILDLVDLLPLLSPLHLELARWMGDAYFCPLYEALEPMLPPAFEQRHVVSYQLAAGAGESASTGLAPLQVQLLAVLREHETLTATALRSRLAGLGTRFSSALAALERAGLVHRVTTLERPRMAPRLEATVERGVPAAEAWAQAQRLREGGAFRQADALEVLAGAEGPLVLAEARRLSGADASSWEALVRRGLARRAEQEVRRDPLASWEGRAIAPPELTPHQRVAVTEIEQALESSQGGVFLLHGVTGSGKTEVYLRALERTVALGKRGIVLVPEIALTPQTVQRFWARFPGQVAVLHSGLSLREQYDEWRSIREGRFAVVIGSRRAALAPQPDVGLIVVDEEQEWTYKQVEQAPRYHARDVAVEMARRAGAVAILGSATPAVETMFQALRGVYRLLVLPGRIVTGSVGLGYVERPLAQVEVVDLREELRAGNRSIFSRALTQALGEALAAGEQSILFVNRRGAGSAVQCRSCGYTARCRRCSVALVYHTEGLLVCHHCGRRRASLERCPACGRRTIRVLGIGTERVAEETTRSFPTARVLRWDRDAVRAAGGHEAVLGAFLRHEADVLVGTQMLAKGLDLPRVTVVGVVSADVGLHVPDLRSGERTFQVLCQVAGRAGRGFAPGHVIVQTYEPDHYAVRAAAAQDYQQFYLEEIAFRRSLGYPPFARMVRLLYADPSARAAQREAERVARLLWEEVGRLGLAGTRLIGPAPAPLERLRGRYRWHLEVLGPDPGGLLAAVPLPARWVVDVDPVSTL
ncbi:MAG: primosomal protein N' [Chloroflexi bacterium]|nr:primosomal protein N' [Chloroflexota bacterium]